MRRFPPQIGSHVRRYGVVLVAIPLLIGANIAGNMVARYLNAQRATPATDNRSTAVKDPVLSGLKIEREQLELGDVWETPTFVAKLTLTNVTAQPITVDRFNTGCECSNVEPKSLTVPAGERGEVSVHIDLMHRQPHQYGVARRELNLPFSPTVGGKGVSHGQWVIHGTVCSRASLAEMALQFGDEPVQSGSPVTKSMPCHIHQPGVRVEATLAPEVGTVTVTHPEGKPATIAVTPNPKMPVGPFRFDVPLTVVRPDGVREPGPVLPVYGEMRSAFQVSPSQLLLGEHSVGTVAEAEFSVTLPPGTDYTVKQVGAESPDTTVKVLQDEVERTGGRRITYSVSQRVAPGDKATAIGVLLGNARGEKETLRVRLSYYGMADAKLK